MQKNWFSVKVRARTYIIKIWLSVVSSKLLICWFDHKLECPVEKLNYCIQGQGHSEGSICQWLSGWYLLNCRLFCFWTWYGDAASWAKLSERATMQKKRRSFLSRSRSQRGCIWCKYDTCFYIFWSVHSLATKLGLMIHYIKPECPVKKIGLHHLRSRSQWRIKMII